MTNVTLRKANELERGLNAAATKIKFDRVLNVSIHRDESVVDLVRAARETMNQNLGAAVALVKAAHTIRASVSKANAESGINALLSEKAALDAEEKIINQVIGGADPARRTRYDLETGETDLTVAQKQIDMARTRALTSERYIGSETVSVQVMGEDEAGNLSSQLSAIQLRKRAIADELLSANMSTKISLAPETVALLKQFKLLA